MILHSIVAQIDSAFAANVAKTEDGFRTHLGASVIGDACSRKIWFAFRWAGKEDFSGRMLRLFERGQLEEERFAKLLQLIGATVFTHDDTGRQFCISEFGGHFGGSCDGVAVNLPGEPEPTLLEMKTHNDKSFKKLAMLGVEEAKPQHYKQAQVYMRNLKLKQCLYMAVNKDTDELHLELFPYKQDVANRLIKRAEHIIFDSGMPVRISENQGYFECRFCPMNKVCFKQGPALMNCRTCRHSKPERDGTWSCAKEQPEIVTKPKQGCGQYECLTELL